MKKKLERQLLAAGIEIGSYFDEDSNLKSINVIRNGNRYLNLDQSPAPTFKECKEFLQFEGNDWDGLKERLEESEDWVGMYLYRNVFENKSFSKKDALIDLHFGYWSIRKEHYVHSHQKAWELLDKIDAAKAKGGKQVVKFKGNKYEFDFPPIAVLQKGGEKVIDKGESKKAKPILLGKDNKYYKPPNGNIVIEECNEHTEEQLKELKPSKRVESEPNEPAWKSVTGWDSIKGDVYECYFNTLNDTEPESGTGRFRENFATEKQAQQILAFSQLTQIHKAMMEGEKLVNFNDTGERGFIYSILFSRKCRHNISSTTTDLGVKVNCTPFEIDFYTEEQRDHFIKHNTDLINQYLGI